MAKRDTQRETRPPQRRGHYSEDSRSWWDEGSGRWFPLTDDQDTLRMLLGSKQRGKESRCLATRP